MPTYVDTGATPNSQVKAGSGTKRSEQELQTVVGQMVKDALTWHQSSHAQHRIDATKYYRGERFGDEQVNRSKVVMTTVRDAVLQIMPGMMDVFFGPDGAVEFVARRADAVEVAEQSTDYVNYVFTEDNPGFESTYWVLKDGFVRRLGIFKWYWEEKTVVESESFANLTPDQFKALKGAEKNLEIIEEEKNEDGTINATLQRTIDRGRVRIEAVPPREFIYNRGARTLDDATLVAHVTRKTKGELMALGYTRKQVEEAQADALLANHAEEAETARPKGEVTALIDNSNVNENAPMTYVEAYATLDYEGEGVIELRKVCMIGAALKIVHMEHAPEKPFALFTPDPEPHEIQGLDISDQTMDLQRINSHIARGMLDSLSLALTPRSVINEDVINVRDAISMEVGGIVRARGDVNAIRELTHKFVGADAVGILDFFKGVEEGRLGTTRAAAGLNPDALQSSSPGAVANTVNKEQARHKMMARVFAELCFKRMFKGVYNLLRRHQDEKRVVRLRGKYMAVDPSAWPVDPDVKVRVGLGSGTREERIAFLGAQAAAQKEALVQFGPGSSNPLTDLSLYRATIAEMVKLAGYDPARFWKEIGPEQMQALDAQASQGPAPDPAAMIAQVQVQNENARLQLDQQKAMADAQYKMAQIEMQREQNIMADQRERAKLAAEIELRAREMELKYGGEVVQEAIHAIAEQQREETSAGANIITSAIDAEAAAQPPASPEVPMSPEVPPMPEEGMI